MKKIIFTITLSLIFPLSSMAAGDPLEDMIKARQSVMILYGFHMGTLGAMAKGKIEYNAEAAAAAAKNIHLTTQLNTRAMWAPGTDNSVPALKDLTKAKPEAWSEWEKLSKIDSDFKAAAEKLAGTAGNGLDALRADLGAVGKTCKGCHEVAKAK
jgi:cytochrome c556